MPGRGTGSTVIASGLAGTERHRVGANREHAAEAVAELLAEPGEPLVAGGDEPLDLDEAGRRPLLGRGEEGAGQPGGAQRREEPGAADRTVGLEEEERAVEPGRLGRDAADRQRVAAIATIAAHVAARP